MVEALHLALSERKFGSPEEELSFLRTQVAEQEKKLRERGVSAKREEVLRETLRAYSNAPTKKVLKDEYALGESERESIILNLSPEPHDARMQELVSLLKKKGVHNALSLARDLSPHIADDLHRFLVEYLKEGLVAPGLKEKSPLFRALSMTLYEIALPSEPQSKEKTVKELVSSMEQFYAGMLSIAGEKAEKDNYWSIELANPNHTREFVFFVGVPDSKRDLFEKHMLSVFPEAKLTDRKDDYNIFSDGSATAGSRAKLAKHHALPLKLYEEFSLDPISVILNSFSKLDEVGEGAAIQILMRPAGDSYAKEYSSALEKLRTGKRAKDVLETPSLGKEIGKIALELIVGAPRKKAEKEPAVDEFAVTAVSKKMATPIVHTELRIITSARDLGRAHKILLDIESSFNQFESTVGNKLVFEHESGRSLEEFLRDYSFRIFENNASIPLSIAELTTLMHFPKGAVNTSQLRQSKAGEGAAPLDLPTEGTIVGVNRARSIETKIFITAEDRLRHFYTIGQTGTGKTTLLKNMIAQDMARGSGVCMIDPHGSDIEDVLGMVPRERFEDVIYFDPSYTDRPMALNMLEFDSRFPEQKTFVVNEMLSIFEKLFDMKTAGGPMFEQYFRNAVLLTLEDTESGSTLLDVSRVLANKEFRALKLSRSKNPIVNQFWREVAEKAGGEAALANMVPYITSKFDNFLANDIMRPIISQERSTFNFREIMDEKKILLVNLAKGRLGDINSHLLGLVLVGKILMAALSRVDSFGKDMPDFYLYIDEFQNITTGSIATILSEARKYKLSLTIAHQFIAQLDEKIKNAVFGNVGSMAVFRTGTEDAEFLAKQFEPVFTQNDLVNLDNRHAYMKMLAHGRPVKPFDIETLSPQALNRDLAGKLKELSYLKYGRDREEVEAEIMEKYKK